MKSLLVEGVQGRVFRVDVNDFTIDALGTGVRISSGAGSADLTNGDDYLNAKDRCCALRYHAANLDAAITGRLAISDDSVLYRKDWMFRHED